MTISLFSGPQDVSQLDSLLNTLVNAINAGFSGATPTTNPVVTGTTSAALPASGVVLLGSTTAGAAYTMSAPVRGQSVRLINGSTKNCTIAGLFNKTKTKLTLTSTTGAKIAQMAVSLVGPSTAAWGVSSVAGNVKST
jgi:hypothetical protein